MADNLTKGLEFAADLAKQIITLATGTIALTLTFAEKFDPDGQAPIAVGKTMFWAWGLYVLSIFGAIWFMMALSGSANEIAKGNEQFADVMNSNTRIPAALMISAFLLALILTIVSV
jgi:hypothetical protein